MRVPTLALLVPLVSFADAQSGSSSGSVVTVTLPPYVPNGQQSFMGQLQSTYPLECVAGCEVIAPEYYYCFINNTLPNGQMNDIAACLGVLCQQANYNLLSACLNCVVANGMYSPYDAEPIVGNEQLQNYTYTVGVTATPSPYNPADSFGPGSPVNPNGLLNATQANGWLTNVTDRCAALNATLTGGTTVTATPTTSYVLPRTPFANENSGPYVTSWTSGATVSLSVWTGLTSFTSALSEAYASQTVNATVSSGAASASVSSTPGASGGAPSSSAAAASGSASASAKSAGFKRVDLPVWIKLVSMLF